MAVDEGRLVELRGEPAGLLEQLADVLNYKWHIAGIAVLFVLVAVVIVYSQEPIYRATNVIQIEYRQNQVLNMREVYDTGSGTLGYYATQVAVLASRDLASKAVDRIDWTKYPDFLMRPSAKPTWSERLGQYLPFLAISESAGAEELAPPPDADRQRRRLVTAFMRATKIEPVVTTQIVNIHFLSKYPELAMEAANALAAAYIDSGFEAQFEATRRATEWLNDRLVGVRENLAASERELQTFREDQDLVNIRGGRGVLEDELNDNLQRLRDAERKMTQLQHTYEQIQRGGYSLHALQELPAIANDELVQRTREIYIAAQQNLSELQSRYKAKHPKMIQAQARLQEAKQAVEQQLRTVAESVRNEYRIAADNVGALSKQVEKAKNELRSLDRKDYQLQVLDRDTETNRELYDAILKRFKETDISGDFAAVKAQIVDPAIVPDRAYLPRKRRALMLAAFFGVLAGVGLALIRRHLDTSIKTGDELEIVGGAPVFASIPAVGRRLFKGALARMVEDKPRTPFAEGMRTIRTGIMLADLDHKKKRILLTSALEQEGKSCLASNLGIAFSQMERVLLIDCDLRRPNLSRSLGLKANQPGLSELLQGTAERKQAVHKIGENLDLLPVGKLPAGPGQVLASERFWKMIDVLGDDYDRVIIDSAPCQPVSDTLLLAKHVDGVVFVVRYDSTGEKTVRTALKRLKQSRAPILGLVLNRVDHRAAVRSEDSYYYGHGYYG